MNKGEFVLGIPVRAVGSDQVMTLGGTPDNWTCTWNENGKVRSERFDPGKLERADATTRK
jgi:hypothetical protein